MTNVTPEEAIRTLLRNAFKAAADGNDYAADNLYEQALDIDIDLTERLKVEVARETGWLPDP